MKRMEYVHADVFTRRAFGGNQLAVFLDARGLTTEQMQTLAAEMNFSESTFVLPPESEGAAARVRIFTPAVEMPMAGHPTVGTSFVLAERGLAALSEGGEMTLDLGIGPVKVEVDRRPGDLTLVWMTHRPAVFGPVWEDQAAAARAVGLEEADLDPSFPIQVVSTGVPFLMIPLRDLSAAARSRSETAALNRLFEGKEKANVALFTLNTTTPDAFVHLRMYAPHMVGIVEDPATGSCAAPLGAYLDACGRLPAGPRTRFTIEQGIEMGRPSQILVDIERSGNEISRLRIGGYTVIAGEGVMFVED